jgi:hypothetical protein
MASAIGPSHWKQTSLSPGCVPAPDSLGQYGLVDLGAIAGGATRAFELAGHSRPASTGRVAIDLRALPGAHQDENSDAAKIAARAVDAAAGRF